MGAETYTSREGLKDMAAATGNTKYYELVAMPLDKDCYKRVHCTFDDGLTWPCIWFYWDESPEFVEIVW